jgi:NitT/TauT family transport system substrate-binding protein
MKSHSRLHLFINALLILMLFAACAKAPQQVAEPTEAQLPTVKIQALDGGITTAVAKIIEDQGFDKANGFKGEFYQVGGDASIQFMLQRNSDVSFDCDLITPALLRSQGYKISTFYPIATQDATLVVRGDSPYQTAEDLIGKLVGQDGLESGTMTAAQIQLSAFHGIQIEKDYNLQLVDEAALMRLLNRGDLEAIFLGQPEVLISQATYGTRSVWGPAGEEWTAKHGGHILNVSMCAYEDWLVKNPDLARGVMAAWDDALAWIKADPSRLAKAPFPDIFGIEDPKVMQGFVDLVATSEYFTNSWTEEDVQAGNDFLKFAADIGTVIQTVPENSVVRLETLLGK